MTGASDGVHTADSERQDGLALRPLSYRADMVAAPAGEAHEAQGRRFEWAVLSVRSLQLHHRHLDPVEAAGTEYHPFRDSDQIQHLLPSNRRMTSSEPQNTPQGQESGREATVNSESVFTPRIAFLKHLHGPFKIDVGRPAVGNVLVRSPEELSQFPASLTSGRREIGKVLRGF